MHVNSKPCSPMQSTNDIGYVGLLFDDDSIDVTNYLQRLDNMEGKILQLQELQSSDDEVFLRTLIERVREYFWGHFGDTYKTK